MVCELLTCGLRQVGLTFRIRDRTRASKFIAPLLKFEKIFVSSFSCSAHCSARGEFPDHI
jgi:hypothetical protein